MIPMKLDIQMFGTVVKELYPGWVDSKRAFRPYGIISYEQNQINNTTTYRMDLYGQLLDTQAVINQTYYDFTTNVCGQTKNHNGIVDTTYVSNGQKVYLGFQEVTVVHQTNGSANQQVFQIGGSARIYSVNPEGGAVLTNWIYQGTSEVWPHTAPTIPRVSPITSNANSSITKKDFGTQVNFTISRYSDSFTHALEFVSGGATYTIGTGLTTSGSYIFPVDLIPNYPSSGSPTITVTCKTYNGSTLVGSSTTTVYLNVPSSYVPTCSLVIDDDNTITKAWGIWVKSRSVLKGIITAEGVANSTISSYLSTFDGSTFNTNSFSKTIATSDELTVTSTVTDSRTRTASDSEVITVVDYTVPTIISAAIKRCLVNGILDDFGTYGKIVCEYAISPCENHNAKSLKVSLGSTTKTFSLESYSGTYTATDLFENIEINATYNFNLELIDSFETIPQTVQVIPSYTLYSLRAGGKGFTFGRVATEDGLHDYLGATFHNGLDANEIKYNNHELLDLIYPVGRGFIDHTDTDYSNYLGFTWQKTLVGMTPIGKDSAQTEFNTIGKIGGNKSNTHGHGLSGTGAAQIGSPAGNANALGFRASQVGDLSGSTYSPGNTQLSYAGGHPNRSHNTDLTGTTNNTTITILPPYQVVNFWKRTA